MKSYELEPTHENLMQSFLADILGRNKDIFAFADILNSLEDSCSIAIDGSWGSGKTFFVNQVKMLLDANNDFVSTMNEEDKAVILSQWKRFHKGESPEFQLHMSVYYDAWENDNDEDPILSLIYAILKNANDDFSIPSDARFVKIAANILEFFTGKKWGDLIESFRSEDPLDKLKKEKAIETEIRRFLDALLEERGNRLVIFVDELDRCNPSYAVRLLERIKHYFSNDRITFVFSVNTSELQHTIKRYYGGAFDACRYLDRFFDLRMSIPPADYNAYYRSIDFNKDTYLYDIMCHAVICKYNLSIREAGRYLRNAKMAAYEAVHDSGGRYSFAFADGKTTLFCLTYVVPIMLGLRIVDLQRYESFVNGKDPSPLVDFMDIQDLFGFFLAGDESYDNVSGCTVVTAKEKLKEAYDAIFNTNYGGDIYNKKIGQCGFDKQTKDTLLRVVSLFSKYTYID